MLRNGASLQIAQIMEAISGQGGLSQRRRASSACGGGEEDGLSGGGDGGEGPGLPGDLATMTGDGGAGKLCKTPVFASTAAAALFLTTNTADHDGMLFC